MKILIMGLPGSGKTTLAKKLVDEIWAVHFNADKVRQTMNVDLSFSVEDRVEHARRMGWMCQYVKDSGFIAIADFICPTPEARAAFGADKIVWMNTITTSRYPDTDLLFSAPEKADLVLTDFSYNVDEVIASLLQ